MTFDPTKATRLLADIADDLRTIEKERNDAIAKAIEDSKVREAIARAEMNRLMGLLEEGQRVEELAA